MQAFSARLRYFDGLAPHGLELLHTGLLEFFVLRDTLLLLCCGNELERFAEMMMRVHRDIFQHCLILRRHSGDYRRVEQVGIVHPGRGYTCLTVSTENRKVELRG